MILQVPIGSGWSPSLGQAEKDENLRQMIDIQKEINAIADKLPPGTIPKEKLDAIMKRLDECQTKAGMVEGVQCLQQVYADFKALAEPSKGVPTWAWILGGAAAAGLAVYVATR